jgi:NADH oxidase (H2O2-forming)
MNIVILGSGIAGYTAAHAVKRTNRDVNLAVVSEESDPTYSACVFAEYIAGEIKREHVFLAGQNRGAIRRSEWVPGRRVARINLEERTCALESGQALHFDRLILATGSRPIVPKWPGVGKDGVYLLKTMGDADAVCQAPGKDAVVVGAGPVGLEVAVALQKRGWNVSVLELLETIVPRLFPPIQSRMIHTLLERQGIRLLVAERLERIEGKKRVEAVVTDKRTLDCQLVLLGIGMRPEVGLAEDAGLRIGSHGGIAVDQYMRTSHEDVFACGDCVESVDRLSGQPGLNMLWANAKMQGAVAGLNSLGLGRKYPGTLNMTTLKLYDTTATSVGAVDLVDESHGEMVRRHGEHSSVRLVVSDGLIKGIQVLGPRVDMSVFLRMMLSGERLHCLRESRDRHALLRQKPWLARLPADLRE